MGGIPELVESDVTVTNTRGGHAATIAEHTIGMLITLARGFRTLDVQSQEPLPKDSPLWKAPRLIPTPHCSGASEQTTAERAAIFRENLGCYLAGQPLLNLVDKRRGF
jgi:phosphoglycerate dehydrogenase-like enzyme